MNVDDASNFPPSSGTLPCHRLYSYNVDFTLKNYKNDAINVALYRPMPVDLFYYTKNYLSYYYPVSVSAENFPPGAPEPKTSGSCLSHICVYCMNKASSDASKKSYLSPGERQPILDKLHCLTAEAGSYCTGFRRHSSTKLPSWKEPSIASEEGLYLLV